MTRKETSDLLLSEVCRNIRIVRKPPQLTGLKGLLKGLLGIIVERIIERIVERIVRKLPQLMASPFL